jgi:hypothetical protein
MQQTFGRLYPRFERALELLYTDAVRTGPAGRIHDLSTVFNKVDRPVFVDAAHLNEAGNRLVAEAIASRVAIGRNGVQ